MAEELGISTAMVIGFLGRQIDEQTLANGQTFIQTTLYCLRPIKRADGPRRRHVNQFQLTATGTAAENLARNFRPRAKVFISGELTIHQGYAQVHCAQLHWISGGEQL